MNGMEMMLKSFGLEPEKIKAGLMEAQASIMGEINKVHEKLTSIDDKLTRIEIKFETIPTDEAMKLLSDGEAKAKREAEEYVRSYNDGNGDNGNDAIN